MFCIDGDFGKAQVWFTGVLLYCSAGHTITILTISTHCEYHWVWWILNLLEIVFHRQLSLVPISFVFCWLWNFIGFDDQLIFTRHGLHWLFLLQ